MYDSTKNSKKKKNHSTDTGYNLEKKCRSSKISRVLVVVNDGKRERTKKVEEGAK